MSIQLDRRAEYSRIELLPEPSAQAPSLARDYPWTQHGSVVAEFEGIELGDLRLNKRLSKIVKALEVNPAASFPDAVGGNDSELRAVYRFFDNEHIEPEELLVPHHARTWQRARDLCCQSILVAHDSSDVNFKNPDPDEDTRANMERVSRFTQGMHIHLSLALSGDGLARPLGLLGTMAWARGAKEERRKEKESARWVDQIQSIEMCHQDFASGLRVVHLADREVDSYSNLFEMHREKWCYIFRAQYDRALKWSAEVEAGAKEVPDAVRQTKSLRAALLASDVRSVRRVRMSSRGAANRSQKDRKAHPPRAAREAHLELRAQRVPLAAPDKLPSSLDKHLWVNVVGVFEVNAPEGEAPIEWLLYTSEAIETREQVEWVVSSYCARWRIEEYFKALKTGCSLEKRQLKDFSNLYRATCVLGVLAWRLLLLRSLAEEHPDLDARTCLSESELLLLAREQPKHVGRKQATLKQALEGIAAMGGWLRRNGRPGWQTLWKGYLKLSMLHRGFLLALAVIEEQKQAASPVTKRS